MFHEDIWWKEYLISFQMIYKSKFQKIDPYDWFCGPGSHMRSEQQYVFIAFIF